jgi:hypothetical protein
LVKNGFTTFPILPLSMAAMFDSLHEHTAPQRAKQNEDVPDHHGGSPAYRRLRNQTPSVLSAG